MLISFVCSALPVEAASGPTITTTLTDNIVQRGSKKTFDVWARNSAGDKIKATVKLNGQTIEPTWDDSDKTSYTLIFTKEGENIVTVVASSDGGRKKELTYHITYKKANPGDVIGSATWSVELFTIGCGYLIYPVEMPIYEGETAAEQLIRLLHNNGFAGYYNGTPKSAFYLGYIADGTASGAKYNNYSKSGTPQNPKKLNLSPAIPSILVPHLNNTMTFFDSTDYKNWEGYIGEFAFTNGSGWMYSVNNNFPNVGFADAYLSDGDVVRVQFTLAYGADIGGLGSVGGGNVPDVDNQPESGFYAVANKDELNKTICRALSSGLMSRDNVKKAYETALTIIETLNASQSSINNAVSSLNNALANPSKDTGAVPPETPPSTGGSTGSGNSGNTGGSSGSGNSGNAGSSGNTGNTGGSSGSGNSDNTDGSSGSGNSSNTGDSSGSVNSGNTGNSSGSGNSSDNTSGASGSTEQTPSTGETDTSERTESNGETEPVDPSTDTQDPSDPEITDAENSSGSNTPTEIEDADGSDSAAEKDGINTGIADEGDNKSPVNPFVITGVIVICVAASAVIIAVYIRSRKAKVAGSHETKGRNADD